MDDIVSEPVDLEVSDAPVEEAPPEPETKRRAHRATSKAAPKARVRAPVVEVPDVAEVVEVEPPVEPSTPAPKARARPAVRATAPALAPAPAPAPGISDVLNMLANALLDQRQARASQRQAMYSRFLD